MWRKNTLLKLLAGLLLAQCAAAVPPHTRSAAKDTSSAKESQQPTAATASTANEATSEDPMLVFVLNEFHKVTDFALQAEKELAQRVLDDAALAAENGEAMRTMRRNLTKFINDVNEINSDEACIDPAIRRESIPVLISVKCLALTQFLQLVQEHNSTILMQPTGEDFLIENTFKRHGWTQFKTDLKEHFHNFIEEIESKLTGYQKLDGRNVDPWADQFMKADKEKQLQLLSSYLILNRSFPL